MKTGGILVGMGAMVWVAAGSARADSPSGGLAGLDAAMNGTGRIASLTPRSDLPIGGANIPDEEAMRKGPKAAAASSRGEERRVRPAPVGFSEQEFAQTEEPVANCRIEVARRRRVPPAQVAAGTVILRFTVAPSGRVHDAEAVWASNTDLEVAACAKRVLSDWTFARHAAGDINVEHEYRLAESR